MPITEQVRVNSYTGNGSTTVFAYGFKAFVNTDLLVQVDGVTKTLTTDYTVSGVGVAGGGNVTFVTAPANLALVNISGEMPYKRDTDYIDNGDLRAQTLDDDLDRIVILEQQLRRDVKRAIKLPVEETDDKGVLTTPTSRVNKVLAFDATGAPVVKAIADLSITVTAVDASLVLASGNLRVDKPVLAANAGGTVDAITTTVSPAPASLTNGLKILARATGANTSTTPTFNLNSLGAKTIVKGSNAALLAGDIPGAGFWMDFVYDSTLDKWVLNNPSKRTPRGALIYPSAATSVPNSAAQAITLDTVTYDTDSIYQSADSSLKVPTGITKVRLSGNLEWSSNTAGERTGVIYKNGVEFGAGMPYDRKIAGAVGAVAHSLSSAVLTVVAGDKFQLVGVQTSGGALNTAITRTWLAMEIIG